MTVRAKTILVAPPPVTPSCAVTSGWRTDARGSDTMSRDALYLVRAGRHGCFDRVVFDVNGPAEAGFAVRYVTVVTTDPKGAPLPVPGGTTPGWPSLRAVRFAGSFEGRSTFAVGVRAKLPFRVFTQAGPQDAIRRVVVDIAH